MPDHLNYIATWFYKESREEASYYPQVGGKGDSSLVHSIYMHIQVPFFWYIQTFSSRCTPAVLYQSDRSRVTPLPQFIFPTAACRSRHPAL